MKFLLADALTTTAAKSGNALTTILSILLVLVSIALIILVMMQEGDEKGLSGSIAGGYSGNDSYMSKNQGRTKEGQLKKYTRIALAAFVVFALLINILQ